MVADAAAESGGTSQMDGAALAADAPVSENGGAARGRVFTTTWKNDDEPAAESGSSKGGGTARCRVFTTSWKNDQPETAADHSPVCVNSGGHARCRVFTTTWENDSPGEPTEGSEGSARCRVFTTSWNSTGTERRRDAAARAGYGYDRPEMELIADDDAPLPDFDGTPRCDLQTYSHDHVDRAFVLNAKEPLLISRATEGWGAFESWQREKLLSAHNESIFHATRSGEMTLGELLRTPGVYHTGQMNLPHDCYSDGGTWLDHEGKPHQPTHVPGAYFDRRYSPFLHAASADFSIPSYLMPLRALQMGLGVGRGTGIPPEQHPSAWCADLPSHSAPLP